MNHHEAVQALERHGISAAVAKQIAIVDRYRARIELCIAEVQRRLDQGTAQRDQASGLLVILIRADPGETWEVAHDPKAIASSERRAAEKDGTHAANEMGRRTREILERKRAEAAEAMSAEDLRAEIAKARQPGGELCWGAAK